jgi:hypothetical protein
MNKNLILLLLAASFSAGVQAAGKTLPAFTGEKELAALFKAWQAQAPRRERAHGPMLAEQAAAPAALASAAAKSADSITNVQHAGVDEGGIVKLHGDHLVILRRGRLFTVDVRDRQLRPVSTVDAFGAGIDPRGAWYDELLISGNTVAVIGYSYARGGTEIGLFEISPAGALAYKATYHLRSNDYYSSRNYASRLIGSKLVFYTPLYLNPWAGDPYAAFPAMRRWGTGEFKRILPATRIYRSDEPLDPQRGVALHTVTSCDLSAAELNCESSAVLGPPGRVFYVAPESVYVWNVNAAVFRLPLDGTAPSALKASGSPVDQFSFLEENGHLNVLLRVAAHGGRGEAMWSAERGAGALALFRVPLASFSDGRDSAPAEAYRPLPAVEGYGLQNRFVGAYLLYGSGNAGRRRVIHSQAYAVKYAAAAPAHEIPLVHGVDRIEALGNDALMVGSDGKDLHFTSLRLAPVRPLATDRYTRANAAQGETRSHGFFYKDGLIGLPVLGTGRSASLLYLRNQALSLRELGVLEARPASMNDGCRASCVDWYGNARPLFMGGRIFALMGYEIVEGRLAADKIIETARVDFSPAPSAIAP